MLLVDAGNSRIKFGVWDGISIVSCTPVATRAVALPDAWLTMAAPSRVLVSNVAGEKIEHQIREWVRRTWNLEAEFSVVRREAAAVVTNYENPAQLGVDRWLAAIAGFHLADGAVGVIDAGTALTMDIVSADGVHLGGSISPGLSLMIKTLTSNTARLDLETIAIPDTLGVNTSEAISLGCVGAVAGGIGLFQQKIRTTVDSDLQWVLTGGEAPRIADVCDGEFDHVPDLVLRGLLLAADIAI